MSTVPGQHGAQERQSLTQAIELEVPAVKIRNIVGEVVNITFEVIQNKVIIQGEVHKQIFFVGQDSMVHHQQDSMPFSTFVEVPGAQMGMEAQIDATIEHIKAKLSPDGTQLEQKVILELFVKVLELQQIHLETDVDGPLLKTQQVIGEGVTQTLVEGQVTMEPLAIKVTDVDVHIQEITKHSIQNKVIIQGIVAKQIFFIGEDDLGHHQAEEMPFSAFVDIPGAEPGMEAQVYIRVEHLEANLSPDGTTLFQEVVLEIFVKVLENVQVQLAQGPGPLVKLPQVIGEDVTQTMRVSDFTLPQPAIKIVEVHARIQTLNTRVLENKVILQGIVEKQIFFVGEDDVEYHVAEEVPFTTFVEIPGAQPGMDVQVDHEIEHVRHELLTPTQLHQKVMIEFFVKVVENIQFLVAPQATGPLFKVPVVVGEEVQQVLVEEVRIIPVPPIPPEVIAVGALIKEEQFLDVEEQILLEREVELPVLAIKVKEVTAIIENLFFESINTDQLFIEGVIVKQIHFVDTANRVRHLEERIPFTETITLPENMLAMVLDVDVEIEDISFQLIAGGQRISQVVVLRITVQGEESRQIEVIVEAEGPDIVAQTLTVEALEVIGEDIVEVEVVEDIDLPEPAAFPVFVEAFIADVETTVLQDAVEVSGNIVKDLTLETPEETTFTVSEEIPFTFSVVITGALPGDEVQFQGEILDILVDIIEEGMVARQTVILEFFIKVTRQVIMDVVVDVVGPVQIITETVLLNVVDDGIPHPVPVEVVVGIEPA